MNKVEHQTMQVLYREIPVRDNVVIRPLRKTDEARIMAILTADPTIADRVSVAARFKADQGISEEIVRVEEGGHCYPLFDY